MPIKMGLLSTVAVIAVIVILVAAAGFILFQKTSTVKLTAGSAEALVINDIKAQNPTANVTVISVSNSTLAANSWQIVASVVYNGSRPCPTLLIDVFDYPAIGLQKYTANQYTSGCAVNGLSDAPSYVISSPEIAIARSYSSNNINITNYVTMVGYNNTVVTSKFISQSNTNATILDNQTNVWLIKYASPNSKSSIYAILGQNGTIMQTYGG